MHISSLDSLLPSPQELLLNPTIDISLSHIVVTLPTRANDVILLEYDYVFSFNLDRLMVEHYQNVIMLHNSHFVITALITCHYTTQYLYMAVSVLVCWLHLWGNLSLPFVL
jgi:hypothetical protein